MMLPRQLLALWAVLASALPAAAQSIILTPVAVEDLAFARVTGRLYAVLPAGVGGVDSSVVELHPDTGVVVSRVPIPAGPGGGATRVAVSDDGSTLYVGVNGGRSVRRYHVPALTVAAEFALVAGTQSPPPVARALAVVPGTPASVVVAQVAFGAAGELVVYDDGVPRPARGAGLAPVFLSATQLLDSQSFGRYRLIGAGLAADTPATERLSLPVDVVEAGVAYNSVGDVYDLLARQVRGRCRAQGIPVPALDLDRVWYFDSGVVKSCLPSNFGVTGPLATSSGRYRLAVRTGRGRAALVEESGRLAVAQGFDAPLPPPPPQPPGGGPWPIFIEPDVVATLTGCTSCRPGDLFTLVATASTVPRTVEVKAAIILPGGAAIAATALGVSHLVLRNIYPAASATILQAVLPAGLPPGRWFAEVALIDPDTGAVWSRSTVPFEVEP